MNGRIVYHHKPGHTIAIASTQSGKTTGLVVPTILDDAPRPSSPAHSLLILDPKTEGADLPGGEIYALTAGYRATMSRVVCFQPLHPETHQHNPLDSVDRGGLHEVADLQMLVGMLQDPTGEHAVRPGTTGAHFATGAATMHLGLLAWGLQTRKIRSLGDLYQTWWTGLDVAALIATIAQTAGQHPLVQAAVTLYNDTPDKERGSVVSTARNALSLWADPLVRYATARSDFTLRDFREAALPLTLYLNFPFAESDRLLPLTRLVLRQWLEYGASKKRGWRHPMLAILDEFQSLGRLPILEKGLNYFLGTGLSMLLITPSLNYVEGVWGTHHPFLEGCATQVTFGIRDAGVARRVSQAMGDTEAVKVRESVSQRGGTFDRDRSTTTATETQDTPLVSSTGVMDLGDEEVLARVGRHRLRLTKARYWDDPVWAARATIPPPQKGGMRLVG